MIELRRLDHVSLNVRDRPASMDWYRNVLALEQQNEPSGNAEPVFMGAFGACIALFQAEVESPARDPESSGLRHIAFALSAEGFEHARRHLTELEVPFRAEDHGNASSLYFPDPDGHVVELTTYKR